MARSLGLALVFAAGACWTVPNPRGSDCAQDGSCPDGLTCFADWRCWPRDFEPPCDPPCWGAEPFCDEAMLRCIACRADADCAGGSVCAPNVQRCRPGCSAEHPDCPAPFHCDLARGVCTGCTADAECTSPAEPRCDEGRGRCVPCLPHRGGCPSGSVCVTSGDGYACAPGCVTAADCAPPGPGQQLACCQSRCVDVSTSAEHCGGCGNPCHGTDSCCDGVCFDLTTSPTHCGACGRSCYLPNVTGVTCSGSQCSNQGCQQYFGDCDRSLDTNGCEENLSFSADHCGNCGHRCTGGAPHRPAICVLLGCTIGPCEPGWADCNGHGGDGCETPLTTASDCNACGARCASGQQCLDGGCR